MKSTLRTMGIAICVVILLSAVGINPVEGQGTADTLVIYSKGFVDVKLKDAAQYTPLIEGMRLGVGDLIRTGDEAQVEIRLPDKSVLKVGPSSQVFIKELGTVEITKVSTTTFELIKGKIRAVVSPLIQKDSHFIIETENATVGVRGTDFFESFDPDTEKTCVIGLEDCVSLDLIKIPGSAPISICGSYGLTVTGGQTPPPPTPAAPGDIDSVLEEMGLSGDTGEGNRPYITDVFVNRAIPLDRLEGTLVLTADDLTADGTIIIAGRAHDDEGTVAYVEVSIDGATTYNRASGTTNWTYEFVPQGDTEYEIMVRAVNSAGLSSDPYENGPWTIAYNSTDNEEIVRAFVDSFIDGIKTEDVRGIEDTVSDSYDGTVGGFYSKDELVSDGIEDLTGQILGTTITYTLDQVTSLGDRLLGTIHWTIVSGSTTDQGRTTWWLSRSDDFKLSHAEGDWLLRSIQTVEPSLTLEAITIAVLPPCNNSVKILLTVPNVPYSVSSVTVDVETFCGPATIFLDRWYYEGVVGEKNGFGGEAPVEIMSPSCITPFCGTGYTGYLAADPYFTCEYSDYGYNLSDTIMLP